MQEKISIKVLKFLTLYFRCDENIVVTDANYNYFLLLNSPKLSSLPGV